MGAAWSVWLYFFPPRDNEPQQQDDDPDLSSQRATSGEPESEVTKENEQSADSSMTMRCKLALQKSYTDLIQDLDVNRTMDHLYARLILTQEDKQRIEGVSGDRPKRRALLDLLPERSQRAFDELLESLSSDQPWLKKTLMRNNENITEDELAKMEQQLDLQTDLSTAGLQEGLKRNMRDRLDEWKTALEEGVSNREGLLPYINQPCSVTTHKSKKAHQQQSVLNTIEVVEKSCSGDQPCSVNTQAHQQQSVLNTIELVEKSCPGDRISIYGEAGMGKTTLLKQLASSWIEGNSSKLKEKFTFVFLIPLRRVGQGTLPHIICDELKLLPVSFLEELKKSLDLCEHRVLFLLDSYEELRGDVVHAKKSDIDDLITGNIFPKSTVVVTSRPGSELREAKYQTTAKLEDLPESEVKTIIEHHFGGNKDAVDKVQRSFPAMAYLQKPINLALFIFIISQNKHLTLSYTQAELFSLVLQYIMLAFAKKKKLNEFTPQSGSYLTNKDIPKDIRRLFSVIAKKCYEERKKNNVILHIEESDDLKEYLDFGLFTAGPYTNTVLLPHQLFIEYFAAAHVAENRDVWVALFEEIKEKSESRSPIMFSLPDVVRPMGLENVLRFLLALSPQPQLKQMCQQIGSLFVVERKKFCSYDDDYDNCRPVKFDYYTDLIRDCCDESEKRVLATALLKAPVIIVLNSFGDMEDRSHVLLPLLDGEQCKTFLKRMQNINLSVKKGKSTLSCTGENRIAITEKNTFVLAFVHRHDCIIKADTLVIRGEEDRPLDLPASMVTRMSVAYRLRLEYCTLCEGFPDYYMPAVDKPATLQNSSPCPTEIVQLIEVKGLEYCDVITSCQCQLLMRCCRDVRVRALKTCFPKVSRLKLTSSSVVYETEDELISWLSTVQTIEASPLELTNHGEESVCLRHLLNILAERTDLYHLYHLLLSGYRLLLDVTSIANDTVRQNTLSLLELNDCDGDIDLGQLLKVCSRQCPQLKDVTVERCQLRVTHDVIDTNETVKANNELSRLNLNDCKGDIDLGQLLEVCSCQCPRLKDAFVIRCQLQVNVTDTICTIQKNNTRSELRLWLEQCKENVDLGQVLEVCSRQCPQLKEVTVRGCLLQVTHNVMDRPTIDTVKQKCSLSRLVLSSSEGDIDLSQLLEVCSRQCPQLKEVSVSRCQVQVNVSDTSDTVKQNITLSELRLDDCKDMDLGQLLELCSRQCPQLKKVFVNTLGIDSLLVNDEKVESVRQLPGLQELMLGSSHVRTPAGRNLSREELQKFLRRLCPSARIFGDFFESPYNSDAWYGPDTEDESDAVYDYYTESESESDPFDW